MKSFKPTSQHLLILIIGVLFIASFLPAAQANVIGRPLSDLIRLIVSPVSAWLHQAGLMLRPETQIIVVSTDDSEQLREELEKVWQYNRRLEQELEDAQKTIQHLGHMRELMPDTHTDLAVGRIVGSNLSKPSPTLTLNIGTRMGLYPGLAVVSGFNLVGQVIEVTAGQALVRPVTADGTYINLRVVPASAGQPAREAFVHVEARAGLFTGIIGANDPIKIGDLAHLYDESWPAEARGFVVGQVESLDPLPKEPLLRRRVVIKPLRSSTALDRVVVLIPTQNPRNEQGDGPPRGGPGPRVETNSAREIVSAGWPGGAP